MRLVLAHQPAIQAGDCPYRLLDEQGHEIAWVNGGLFADADPRMTEGV